MASVDAVPRVEALLSEMMGLQAQPLRQNVSTPDDTGSDSDTDSYDSDAEVTHDSDIYSYVPAHRLLLVPFQTPPLPALSPPDGELEVPSTLTLSEPVVPATPVR